MSGRGASKWWKVGSSLAKALGGVVAFVSALAALFGSLIALGVVDNPFESTADRLTKGGRQLTDAGSARVNISRVLRGGSRVVSDSGKGPFDFRGEEGSLDYASGLRIIFRRPYMYKTSPELEGVWCKYDLTAAGPGFLWGAMTGFQNDPGAAIRNLKDFGESIKHEDVLLFTAPATHYSGQIDLNKLLARTTDPVIRDALRSISPLNDGKMALEVWLGKADDRVLQLASRLDFPGETLGLMKGKVNVDAVFRFSHFGIDVSIEPPPTGDTAQPGERGCPLNP